MPWGVLSSQGRESFWVDPFAGQAWHPWARSPSSWAQAPRLPEWWPHHFPKSQTSHPGPSLACVAGAPGPHSSGVQMVCLGPCHVTLGQFWSSLSLPGLPHPPPGGRFPPSSVEPPQPALGLQTWAPAVNGQDPEARTPQTDGQELPGGQRTENLVGGDWGVTEVQGGRRALKEEPEFYRKSGEGLPGTVQPKQRGVSAGRRAGSSGHVWNMATAYRKCVAGAGAFTTPPGWDKT